MASAPRFTDHWQSLAEQRILAAQREGQFDNLPGFGRPIAGLDDPDDELWWVRAKLRREGLSALPAGLSIRRDVEQTLAQISQSTSEEAVREIAAALNDRVRRALRAGGSGVSSTTMPLDIDKLAANWRQQNGLRQA